MRVAASAGLRVAVQSTGHGATETMQDAILVSTAALDELTVHADERWARIGAGVRWAAVLEACAPYGLAGLAGSSPDVGVVGYLTGGGLGPVARTHGLASDTVRAFEVVTGDGVARRVTATNHPELFWGLRGGKGTLGIVTAVEIDLVEQAELYAGALWFAGADASAVVRTWSRWCDVLPEEGTTSIAVMRLPDLAVFPEPLRGTTSVAVRFAWTGDPAVGEEMIRAIRSVATPLIDTVQVMPYAALGDVHSDPDRPDAAARAPQPARRVPAGGRRPAARAGRPGRAERAGDGGGAPAGRQGPRRPRGAQRVPVPRRGVLALHDRRDDPGDRAGGHRGHRARARRARAWARDGGLPNFTDSAGPQWAQRVFTPAVARRLQTLSMVYDPDAVLLAARGVRS